jgi:hypothetical protein
VEHSDVTATSADRSRHGLFVYLTVEESNDYLAIMDLFSATLLTDLSADEVSNQLTERGLSLDRDVVEERCRQLVRWGNLVSSLRDARVSTVAEYIRSRSRFQVSKLGGRLHREAVAILHASDGAREVARELLGQIVQSLDRILAMLEHPGTDADALAGEVTTIFSNQRLFTDSVRDFYAYLAGILSRYDLGGEEYAQFKELLLVYIDLITADVNRHAPAVAHRIGLVLKLIDPLLDTLATLPGLTLPDGTPVERVPGRTRSDWEELAYWYDDHGASGPEQLRAAAGQALGQLITNAKRLLAPTFSGWPAGSPPPKTTAPTGSMRLPSAPIHPGTCCSGRRNPTREPGPRRRGGIRIRSVFRYHFANAATALCGDAVRGYPTQPRTDSA